MIGILAGFFICGCNSENYDFILGCLEYYVKVVCVNQQFESKPTGSSHKKVSRGDIYMKKLKLTSFVLLLLLIVLALSGFIYETIGYKNVKNNFPPEGFMVNAGAREIHVNIKGEKSDLPPVVIETGTGTWSYDWFKFQEELSKYTQVVTYDRAGYGWSDPPDNGFSLEATISDLNLVLEQSGIKTPIILIGHSVGGSYARHFNDQYPEKVAGLILVDSRNEFFRQAAPAYNQKFFASEDQMTNIILARLGIFRLVADNTLTGMPDFISKEKYVQVQFDVPFFKVLNEEIKQISENVKLLSNLQPLNDKPLTVVTPEKADSKAEALGFSKHQAEIINQKWKDAQKKLKGLSSNGKLLFVPNSSHAVMYDQPAFIVDAVLEMGETLRGELE